MFNATPNALSTASEIKTLTNEIRELRSQIDKKFDRLCNDIDFIKNRTATYLGNGTAMTYLIDETPIFVNSNDFGCPVNFINGGRYEENYLAVLTSFCSTDSVFLDIGANLGVFSLRLASHLKHGKIYAFEPNPNIIELFRRSAFLAGYSSLIKLCNFGLSDQNGSMVLQIPTGHAGGAAVRTSISHEIDNAYDTYDVEVKRLDEFLSPSEVVDVIKLDVEGHELSVLHGMTDVLTRNKHRVVILFEKLGIETGIEEGVMSLFQSLDINIYRVDETMLTEVDLSNFSKTSGYFLASSHERLENQLHRNFIRIYATDLNVVKGEVRDRQLHIQNSCSEGEILFYGPYWYLQRGSYELIFEGSLNNELQLTIAERFGYAVTQQLLSPSKMIVKFNIERDLTYFEVVGRASSKRVDLTLLSFKLTRVG